ncbi:MAG: hypothetical protein GEV07_09495 [Streptosporangiales bacterium]|nr:hypothetical protein [Streptosporangiales bacterium]
MEFPAELPYVWGATTAELTRRYGCDDLLPDAAYRMVRATSVAAAPEVVYRWLCQLRFAPYSYDWLDNFGRRSPRSLVPGAGDLAVGQQVMTIFTLASFTPGEELTVRIRPGRPTAVFGDLAVSYVVRPTAVGSRLVGVLRLHGELDLPGRTRMALLAWGDLLMMRKQLWTLADLAERTTEVAA